ncbi:MAG: DUF6596 domain-containing protein [Myxococcota bacterium]
MDDKVRQVVELTARDSYGRLVAWLAAHCGDLRTAEDAVSDALEAALRNWPDRGVPDNPTAWLLTAARRRVIDRSRRRTTRMQAADRLRREAQERAETPFRSPESGFPDRRLELMLVCAHPEIPVAARTPLILQTVLGLTAERIAAAMMMRPASIGQRLVRAKRHIREARLTFRAPDPAELPHRIAPVLDAIYAAYGTGWETTSDADAGVSGLAREALWLGRLLVDLAPEIAEVKGLYALMAHCEARRAARRTARGAFVPLEEQDTAQWDRALQEEAEKALFMAAKQGQRGSYQLEAAIQSIHANRARSGRTDWASVHAIYDTLVACFPSLGAHIGLAASLGRIGRPADGLATLDALPADRTARHQPWWAVRAHLLAALGRRRAATDAYSRAIGLTTDPAVRAWLAERRRSSASDAST